jgi:hypothetical protein
VLHVVAETPLSFLQHLKDITYIERRPLRSSLLPYPTPTDFKTSRSGSARSDCSRWLGRWN